MAFQAERRMTRWDWALVIALGLGFAAIIAFGSGCAGEDRDTSGTVHTGDNANIVAPVEGSDATAKADQIGSVVQHKFGLDSNMLTLVDKQFARGMVVLLGALGVVLGVCAVFAFSEPLSTSHTARLIGRLVGGGVAIAALWMTYNAVMNGG